jgi:hypothetical protein
MENACNYRSHNGLLPQLLPRSYESCLNIFATFPSMRSAVLTMTHRFTSERQLGQKALQNYSQAYDKQLLSKIGGPNTPKPLSVPDRLNPKLDSPNPKWPPSGAISPGYSGFRSPVFNSDSVDLHRERFGSFSTTGPLDDISSKHRGSYDQSIFPENEFGMEENGMRELNIGDRSPAEFDDYQLGAKGGLSLKRRASSPPSEAARDGRPTTTSHTDLYHRRSAQMLVNRNGAPPRFQANVCSLSPGSSMGQRTGSIGSSLGFSTAGSSMTSYGGDQRLSPNAMTESGPVSPYAASRTLNTSPRASLSRPPHERDLSEIEHAQMRKIPTEAMLQSRQNSVASRIPGAYICECCPKKPKKFDSEEDLR